LIAWRVRPTPKLPEPKGAQRLSKDYPIWIDPKEKSVIVEGQIALREGMLEMFACTRNTKEHESIVSANTKAYLVHAALLTLGAEVGHPVRYQPEYIPPAGTEIDVLVRYQPLGRLTLDVPGPWSLDGDNFEILSMESEDKDGGDGTNEARLSAVATQTNQGSAEPISAEGDNSGNGSKRIILPLPQPRLGRFAVRVQYTAPLSTGMVSTSGLVLPLPQPIDGRLSTDGCRGYFPRPLPREF